MGGRGDAPEAMAASSPLLWPRASTPAPPTARDEVRRQVGLAAPLVACSLLQYSLQVVSLMFAGHLGELSLSGASVASSFANVTGFSVLVSLASWYRFLIMKHDQIVRSRAEERIDSKMQRGHLGATTHF
jgi:MATE family multidrug resistance protein